MGEEDFGDFLVAVASGAVEGAFALGVVDICAVGDEKADDGGVTAQSGGLESGGFADVGGPVKLVANNADDGIIEQHAHQG